MAAAVAPYYGVLGGQVEESTVNAIWYEALRQSFPFPQFIIAPEYYTPNNTKVDLVVLENTNNGLRPVFAYEGKRGPITPNLFMNHVAQAAGYLPAMTRLRNGRYYGMLAAGKSVAILEYAAGGGNNQVLKVYGPNLALNTNYNTSPWDIQARTQDLDQILLAINNEIQNTP